MVLIILVIIGKCSCTDLLVSLIRIYSGRPISRSEAYRMIRRRALAAGISDPVCCHSFRATGITVYLENNGTLETAQKIAAHESPRTTKLYDRTDDQLRRRCCNCSHYK